MIIFVTHKIERVKNIYQYPCSYGLEDDMFQNYDMHPEDMNFKVAVIPTKTFDAMLEKTASFSPDEKPPIHTNGRNYNKYSCWIYSIWLTTN